MNTELKPEAIILDKIKNIRISRGLCGKILDFIELCKLRRERNILLGKSVTRDTNALRKARIDLKNRINWSPKKFREMEYVYYQKIYQSRRNLTKTLD